MSPADGGLPRPRTAGAVRPSAAGTPSPRPPSAASGRPGVRTRSTGRGAAGRPVPAGEPSWSADLYAAALRAGHGPLYLRRADGSLLPLEVERWCAEADAVDLEVVRWCEGAVLDVGCGPGRLVAALVAEGRRALGIDVSDAAVARTVGLGGPALRRSVFDPVPGEGRWGTALLLDGNLGIGGDPRALLDRLARLLAPGGLLLAETVPGDIDERELVRVDDGRGGGGAPFPWARLGTPALLRLARSAGWRLDGQWAAGGRRFVALRSRAASRTAEQPNSTAVISSQRARNPSPESVVDAR